MKSCMFRLLSFCKTYINSFVSQAFYDNVYPKFKVLKSGQGKSFENGVKIASFG